MPRSPSTKLTRIAEDDVRRRWSSLGSELRQATLSFADEFLIERMGAAFATSMANDASNRAMRQAMLPKRADPTLLMSTFRMGKLSFRHGSKPVLHITPELVMDGDSLLDRCFIVLPDFLSPRAGRRPMPVERWKDLFSDSASASVSACQQQLAKLIEQALWAMAVEPALKPVDETRQVDESFSEESPTESFSFATSGCKNSCELGNSTERVKGRRRRKVAKPSGGEAKPMLELERLRSADIGDSASTHTPDDLSTFDSGFGPVMTPSTQIPSVPTSCADDVDEVDLVATHTAQTSSVPTSIADDGFATPPRKYSFSIEVMTPSTQIPSVPTSVADDGDEVDLAATHTAQTPSVPTSVSGVDDWDEVEQQVELASPLEKREHQLYSGMLRLPVCFTEEIRDPATGLPVGYAVAAIVNIHNTFLHEVERYAILDYASRPIRLTRSWSPEPARVRCS